MLNPCCDPKITVTDTPDNIVFVVDGVPTLVPKFRGCNDEPLSGGDQLVTCSELPEIPEDINVEDLTYTASTRRLVVVETDGTQHDVTLPLATTSVAGLVELATEVDYPDPTNDTDAVTPAYVKAAIDAIPDPVDVNVQSLAYTIGTRRLTLTETDGSTHNVTLPLATTTDAGLVELATAADYPDPTNDTDAVTPAYLQAVIDAIPDAPTIPLDTSSNILADVIAAPDGLSQGQWRKPNSRAALATELNAVGASRVEVPVTAMDALWGNRAQEPADTKGMMNEDGSLGYGSRFLSGTGEIASQTAINNALDNNGAYLFLSDLATGDELTIPAPRYAGQIMTIRIAAVSPTDEIAINFGPIPILGGVYRRADHKIERGGTGFNRVLMRDGETLVLTGRAPASGWDVTNHNYRLLSGFGWQERESGLVALDFEVSGTTGVVVGNKLTEDFPLPVTLSNPVNFRPVVSDINMTGIPLGDVLNTEAFFVFRAEADANTATTFRLTVINVGPTTGNLGRIRVVGESARLDYAALGGVA